jgi:DnaJ-class molecular chaperone
MTEMDYYQILGLSKEATRQQIKAAYRKLAFEYHPDRAGGSEESADKMKRLNEAYAVLSNEKKRSEYDQLKNQFGSSAYDRFRQNYSEEDIFANTDVGQIFEEMARAFGLRGFDEIFKDFYGEEFKRFEFHRPGMHGGGFVFTGRFGGRQGSEAPQSKLLRSGLGKMTGYLFEKMTGQALPQTGKDSTDIIRLSPEQAREGGPYAYLQRKRDKKLVIKIPPGIRDGQKIRLAGMGEPGKGGAPDGDLFIKVSIKKPLFKRLKDTARDLVKR